MTNPQAYFCAGLGLGAFTACVALILIVCLCAHRAKGEAADYADQLRTQNKLLSTAVNALKKLAGMP